MLIAVLALAILCFLCNILLLAGVGFLVASRLARKEVPPQPAQTVVSEMWSEPEKESWTMPPTMLDELAAVNRGPKKPVWGKTDADIPIDLNQYEIL